MCVYALVLGECVNALALRNCVWCVCLWPSKYQIFSTMAHVFDGQQVWAYIREKIDIGFLLDEQFSHFIQPVTGCQN